MIYYRRLTKMDVKLIDMNNPGADNSFIEDALEMYITFLRMINAAREVEHNPTGEMQKLIELALEEIQLIVNESMNEDGIYSTKDASAEIIKLMKEKLEVARL